MKYVKWIFVVLFICSLTSFVERNKPTSGLNVGDVAPDFMLGAHSDKQSFALADLRGKYVLLSFWASYDAQSRFQNVSLNWMLNDMSADVQLVSVSFDEYLSVFSETIRQDGISPSACYVETEGEASDVFKTYALQKGFRNYLLDAEGVIVAKNIQASELSSYLH